LTHLQQVLLPKDFCTMPKSIFIAGCGFIGLPLARSFASAGWQTCAITGSELVAANLRNETFRVYSMDLTDRASFRRLPLLSFDIVVHCASSRRGGATAYKAVYLHGTQNLLDHFQPGNFVLAGSTSVYAQTDGSWVNEQSPAVPSRETAKILRKTEDLVLASGGLVTRLAGLYGPGRCVPLQKLLSGEAVIEGEGERVMNMINQFDAVNALRFLVENDARGIFNVVDNEPVRQRDWFLWVCKQTGKPLPPYGPRDLARKRGWTSKRVSNQKLQSLGWNPRFPTFREGIGAMLTRIPKASP
jgi:nucleoside-diphosphate-sugar epimerase